MTARDPLNAALDRFDVPPVSAGLADRIVAAAADPAPVLRHPAPRRDRRGMWRRGRQIAIGAIAFTTLSAAAVASGLFGKVGIEVPVLTAMLAPRAEPVHKSKPVVAARLAHRAPVAVPPPPPVVPTVALPTAFAERRVLRAEHRERIAQFVEEHPRAAAVIAQRVGQRLRQREAVRREVLGLPPANPAAPDFRPLTPEERFILRQERRRDFRRFEAILDRRIARRQAMQAAASADSSIENATAMPAR